MAAGYIDFDDCVDDAIYRLADTPCKHCGAPIEIGHYLTRLVQVPMWGLEVWRTEVTYYHPACLATASAPVAERGRRGEIG